MAKHKKRKSKPYPEGANKNSIRKQPPEEASTDKPAPKRRRNRGNRRKRNSENAATAENPSKKLATWNALEVEWFTLDETLSDKKEKGQQKEEIPAPLPLETFVGKTIKEHDEEISAITDDNSKALKDVWNHFCRKRQRYQSKNEETNTQSAWQPTPIQLQTWSILLQSARMNLIGISPTASGKTLAYGAPMAVAANYAARSSMSKIVGIVLVPTRELAQQVAKELEVMISCFKNNEQLRVLACFGGGEHSTQDHVDILCNKKSETSFLVSATPGRFLDILNECQQKEGASSQFLAQHIVLDEADRLAQNSDLGKQVLSILHHCFSPTSTTLSLFSATYPHKVQEQWKEWMLLSRQKPCAMVRVDAVSMETSASSPNKKLKVEPKQDSEDDGDATETDTPEIQKLHSKASSFGDESKSASKVPASADGMNNEPTALSGSHDNNDFLSKIPAHLVQTLHVCAEHKKARKLLNTLGKVRKEEKQHKYRQKRLGIIFFGRIKTLQYISKFLKKESNHSCLELHSQLPQHVRNKNVQIFQAGRVPLLLATDIAARGVHVPNVSFVINYDFPGNMEQYVHRCGRAGRNYEPGKQPQTSKLPPVVYSFFTRNLAPLAADLVSLLRASSAWVDPNLQALVNEEGSKKKPEAQKRPAPNQVDTGASETGDQKLTDGVEASSDEEDEFPELSGKRIVLQRASHVSDASSCTSDEEQGGDNDLKQG